MLINMQQNESNSMKQPKPASRFSYTYESHTIICSPRLCEKHWLYKMGSGTWQKLQFGQSTAILQIIKDIGFSRSLLRSKFNWNSTLKLSLTYCQIEILIILAKFWRILLNEKKCNMNSRNIRLNHKTLTQN